MNAKASGIFITLFLFLSTGCIRSGRDNITLSLIRPNRTPPAVITVRNAVIDLSAVQQTIRGFGGSSAWMTMTDADMNTLCGTDSNQLGLTILRIRIDPAGSAKWPQELNNAQKAMAHRAIVMASPWSPPAAMKTNNSTLNGGNLLTSDYAAYSVFLSSFVTYMAANGAPLYAISVQNEPEISESYESCVWTPANLLNFVKNYAPATGATKLMASESFHFDHAYTDPILNDTTAASHISIVAGHIYGGGIAAYPLAVQEGKEVWMTEHLNMDTTWAGALNTAKEISDCLALANFNAYNFWWLKKSWGPVDSTGNPTRRGYAMAQFARYIRPGYQRVTASYNLSADIYLSAYKNGTSVVIVAINIGDSLVSQPFSISGGAVPGFFTPHITSGTANITTGTMVKVIAGGFTYPLPAQSITTFVSN